MAGDWIKVRCDLQTHPKVVRILSAMRPHDVHNRTDKFRVIGGLHAVWTVFDQHSTDGRLEGYTPETMDHVIGWEGFSQAMLDVGWMEFEEPQTLVMPEFSEHNGQSGKRRAEDQKRKREARKASATCPQSVRKPSEKNRTREEKRYNPPVSPQDREKQDKQSGSSSRASRGERIPDGFPNDEALTWATENFPRVDHNAEAAKFRDYWTAVPGAKGRKADWMATWRNWIRRSSENAGGRPGQQREPVDPASRRL